MSDTDNANSTPDAAKKKGGKKLLIIGILVVLLLGGAGGGFYFWKTSTAAAAGDEEPEKKKGKKKKNAEGDEEAAAEGHEGEKASNLSSSIPDDEDVTAVVELPPFIVNLADSEQARYLRMTVSLGVAGEGEKSEKPDQLFITRVRNAMLAVLAEKRSDEVLTVDGKTKLRKELLKAAQAASEEPHVHAIYITDFIVQL